MSLIVRVYLAIFNIAFTEATNRTKMIIADMISNISIFKIFTKLTISPLYAKYIVRHKNYFDIIYTC